MLGAATAVAAVGFEWRARAPSACARRPWSSSRSNALVLAGLGAHGRAPSATAWLAALAGAHLAAGLAIPPVAARHAASSRWSPSRSASCSATSPSPQLADGLPLVLGWAAGSAGFAALARAARHRGDEIAVLSGLGGHLLLAIGTAFTGVAPVEAVGGTRTPRRSPRSRASPSAPGRPRGCCPTASRTAASRSTASAVTLLVVWTAVALDGAALTIALAGEAAALARGGAAHAGRDDAADLGLGVLAVALGHGLVVLAPPEALASGLAGGRRPRSPASAP